MEIVLLILGVVLFAASFVIPEKTKKADQGTLEIGEEQVKEIIDGQMKEAKEPKESVQEKETEDTSREGLTGLFGENESFEDQDVTALLDLLGDDDSELAEINELLKKSDQNEPVDEDMFAKMHLSARSYHRILKVARTIADLGGHDTIQKQDIQEAILYREAMGEWN